MLRMMFINYSPLTVTFQVTTTGSAGSFQLLTTTNADRPEGPMTRQPADQPWDLVIGPGEISGILSDTEPENIDPMDAISEVTIIRVSDLMKTNLVTRDPWPTPPPAPSAFDKISDFEKRYKNFLLAARLE